MHWSLGETHLKLRPSCEHDNDNYRHDAGDNSLTKDDDLEAQLGVHLKAYRREYKSLQEICFEIPGRIFLIELPIKGIRALPNDCGGHLRDQRTDLGDEKKVEILRQLMNSMRLHKYYGARSRDL